MGQALRQLVPAAEKSGCCCVWINQWREKVGVIFGSPETTPGGKAMRYAAAVRIDLRRKDIGKRSGSDPHKVKIKAKTIKNKCSAPFREVEYWIEFGQGIVDKR